MRVCLRAYVTLNPKPLKPVHVQADEGLFESSAGSVRADVALSSMLRLATASGHWGLREGVRVEDVVLQPSGALTLVTRTGRIIKVRHGRVHRVGL